jgi:hypothetical protein
MKTPLLAVALMFAAGPLLAKELAPKPESPVQKLELEQALKKVFPSVSFENLKMSACVDWLKKQGVPVEMSPAAVESTKDTTVTLELNNVPALEVLKYITNLTNTKFSTAGGKVTIYPLTIGTEK